MTLDEALAGAIPCFGYRDAIYRTLRDALTREAYDEYAMLELARVLHSLSAMERDPRVVAALTFLHELALERAHAKLKEDL